MAKRDSDPVRVPPDLTGLLCALVYGWSPVLPQLRQIANVSYDDADISVLGLDVQIENARLILTLDELKSADCLACLLPFNLDAKIAGSLTDGATFEMRHICRVSQQGHVSVNDGITRMMSIEASDWIVLNGDPPSLWVGEVEGAKRIRFGGNLNVERVEPNRPYWGGRCHFYLSGGYSYYFVQRTKDETWYLVIDTHGTGVPDADTLGRDFHALQFVLGQQMRLPVIFGLNPDRQTVACATGCDTRPTLESGSFPPVPIERDNEQFVDDSWAAVFFEQICATWQQRPAMSTGFWTVIDMYLDAMRNHIHSDYMRLQIALEAFAYSLLSDPSGERLDVRDKSTWTKWVKENAAAIRSQAIEGREDALVNKVIDAGRLSSGKVVPTAFSEHGIHLTAEMKAELSGRNVVVHQGVMRNDEKSGPCSLQRVMLVRAMVVALIARATGYDGAINGWKLGAMGYPKQPDNWWVVGDVARQRAARCYVAHEQLVHAPHGPAAD